MVDVSGHLGMTLLMATPIWFVYDRRTALTFVGLALPFGMLPDVDLYLRRVLPTIHHHGITHTVLFVLGVSLAVGVLVTPTLLPYLRQRGWLPDEEIGNDYAFVVGAFAIGSLSHLFADMLSAPDISEPIEPYWPIVIQPVSVDVFYYNSPLVNFGLLTVGIVAHLVLWRWRA